MWIKAKNPESAATDLTISCDDDDRVEGGGGYDLIEERIGAGAPNGGNEADHVLIGNNGLNEIRGGDDGARDALIFSEGCGEDRPTGFEQGRYRGSPVTRCSPGGRPSLPAAAW